VRFGLGVHVDHRRRALRVRWRRRRGLDRKEHVATLAKETADPTKVHGAEFRELRK